MAIGSYARVCAVVGLLVVAIAGEAAAGPLRITSGIGGLRRAEVVTGVVSGSVNGKYGPLAGASVVLKSRGGSIVATVVADKNGNYVFANTVDDRGVASHPDIPAGRYNVSARYHANTASVPITIALSATATANIDLAAIRVAGGAAPPPPAADVYFATDRVASGRPTSLKDAFGNARIVAPCAPAPACEMHYGVEHATVFSYGLPQLLSDVPALVSTIHNDFPNATSVIVFVHGYNSDFFDPFQLGATVVAGFDTKQPVIVYSWPSNDQTIKYFDDETNNTWDADHFRDFIVALLSEPGAPAKVNILAHSMGNRLALGALDYLARSGIATTGKIGQVVLAAPDVDSGTFWEGMTRAAPVADGITVYGSNHDEALRTSRDLHGHCRAGLMGCDDYVPPVANLNVVDASLFACDLFGHGYWSASTTMQADIVSVLSGGVMTTSVRPHLKLATAPNRYAFTSFASDDTGCGAKANDVN